MDKKPIHIGDGVYACYVNGQIELTVPAGSSNNEQAQTIYLDYNTWTNLKRFAESEEVFG